MGKETISKNFIEKIVSLRQRGYTISEIKANSGLGQGTISKYIRGIEIYPEFRDRWLKRKMLSTVRREEERQKALLQARNFIKNHISEKDKILIAACLYWAEGAKRDFSLSNTDPFLIKTFVECIKVLGIKKDKLRVTIRIYEDLDKEKVCNFWAKTLELPRSGIQNVNILKGKKIGKLEYGMCRIRVVRGGYLLKLLYALKEVIKEEITPSSFNG